MQSTHHSSALQNRPVSFGPKARHPSVSRLHPRLRCAASPAQPPTPPTSQQRREALWRRAESSVYRKVPALEAPLANPLVALGIIGRMVLDTYFRNGTVFKPFEAQEDVRPARQKIFHTFGAVAKATFITEADSPFDGIFASGAPCLIRLSLATNANNYVAGVAIKFFIEGQRAVNLVALSSLDGQKVSVDGKEYSNRDFFANEPSTSIEAATGPAKVLESVLGMLSKPRGIDPRKISLHPLASVCSDGSTVTNPRVPDKLTLRNADHHFAIDTPHDFRNELRATYNAGDTLYELWNEDIKLGRLRLDSRFVASDFGDRELAFHHQA